MSIKALHEYHKLSDTDLGEHGLSGAALIAKSTYAITTTVTALILKAKAQALLDIVAVCENGTKEDTLNKIAIREELIALFDTLCNDVVNAANAANNPAIVPAYGFKLASDTRTGSVPGLTAIISVTNLGPSRLGLELQHDPAAWCYVVEDTLLPGGTVKYSTFTDPDNVVLDELPSGSMHSLRARTMVAKNLTGPWCEPVQHMST